MHPTLSVTELTRALDTTLGETTQAAAADVPAASAERFQALMAGATPAAPVAHAQQTTAISKLVETADTQMRQVLDNTEYLSLHAGELSLNEMLAASMQLSAEAAAMQIDLQAKMSVVTSTKDAIGSLMKNQ
ncbi:type III secretion protein HrpB2 [Burkholderia sp. FERM BP-3421]|jgi:type III secretion inner rod protein HrpB2|uniref:type III secretion protein HrpB2 n=1 Tax=Burkholderia sp. FERM BP-3421 TaxID=1494466 RepID=UPI002362A48B|nr:type III secretion protein HrpB2 [Burkholderia sp. FERM BP-3421]WDD92584.1 type III secretion protein HrpB2 [Burkholderia sp. FERM BP-3421]